MKEVKAYIRSNMVDAVVDALEQMDEVPAVGVVPLKEFGHRYANGEMQAVEMVKLEMDVMESAVETVVDCILRHARTGTGHPGDGKIFVSELTEAVRIEDGQRGADALRHRHDGSHH